MVDEKKSNVKAIRKDVVIEKALPEPHPEVVAEIEWLLGEAKSGNIQELVYAASDQTNTPIFGIYGDPINFPMMQNSLKVLNYMYFHGTTLPTMLGIDVESIED